MKKAKLKSELCFNLSRLYHFQNSLYASFTNLYQQFFIKQLNHIKTSIVYVATNFILEHTQYLMFKIYRRKMLPVIIKCHFRLGYTI